MSKHKNDKSTNLDFEKIIAHVGLAACSLAALAGLIEINQEQRQPKLVNQMQPAYSNANQYEQPGYRMDIRKEKEEIRHATVSYGVLMRTHPVTGKA